MIKGNHIVKRFDHFNALDETTFHVPKGSVYGLVGPNGAGKSTLIRHITGIFKADSGEVLIDGEPVYENINAKGKLAYIPDDIFYFRQSSMNHLKEYYKGICPNFDEEMYLSLLNIFDNLNPKKPIRTMSKGMQKQAAFILAIAQKPEVLVLDEPVDGLDPVMRRQIWSILMDEVGQREMTVLVSSHNLRELEDVCDYVGIMHRGKVIIERSLTELQGGITKMMIAFSDLEPTYRSVFEILHEQNMGKIHTLIVRGNVEEVEQLASQLKPLVLETMPLSLEEIFIYELGGREYEVKEILGK